MTIDREQFVQLALDQLDAVSRVARGMARHGAEADDLVQETYLRALKAHANFDLQSFGIRPWLLRILHNVHVNRVVRERRQPTAIEADQLENNIDAAAPELPPVAFDSELFSDEILSRALDDLSPELRTILILWAVDELSYKEIAHVLEIPLGTVMSRLHRARRQLIHLLADHPAANGARE